MANIKVHLLNFHGPGNTRMEAVLENQSVPDHTYFSINQWSYKAAATFSTRLDGQAKINQASSTYSFEIEADPNDIALKWGQYFNATVKTRGLTNYNCAKAVQWFLNTYADIPNPSPFSAPVTLNHVILGIFLPSFIPIGVMVPGRVMDNAKFHVEARNKALAGVEQSSSLALSLKIALSAVATASCIATLIAVSQMLLGSTVIVACSVATALSLCGLFKATNDCAANNMVATYKMGMAH